MNGIAISLIQPSGLFLILITICVALYNLRFVTSRRLFRNRSSILPETVHSLESQSLGVVSANLRQQIMGLYIQDPRRNLQLIAMWLETPTFLFVILGSTLGDIQESIQGQQKFTQGKSMAALTAFMVVALCIGIAGIIAIVALQFTKNHRAKDLQQKVLLPLIFDVGFITISSSGIRLVTCQPGMDLWYATNDSCAYFNPHQVCYTFIGLGVFFCLYLGSMYLKTHREANALLVRIRFYSEFLVLVIAIRTSIALYNSNRALLLSFCTLPVVHIVIGLVYSVIMLAMVLYNYYYQPCLGSGRIANNIRALSFTTGFSSSIMVFVAGLMELMLKENKMIYRTLEIFLYAGTPVILIVAWLINDRRARLFHIPELSVAELLKTSRDRYRQVACEAVCLLPHTMISPEMRSSILMSLHQLITTDNEEERCSIEVRSLASKAFLHLQCVEQPENPFGFCIEEDGEPFTSPWVTNGKLLEIDKRSKRHYQRHAVHRNFRLGREDSTVHDSAIPEPASFYSDQSTRETKEKPLTLSNESKEKLFRLFQDSQTSERAILHCFEYLHSDSETARAAASKAVLDLFVSNLVIITANTFFGIAFQFCKYDVESRQDISALETLHRYIVEEPASKVLVTPLLPCFLKHYALYNVTTQLKSECSETVRYAADTCIGILRVYAHWKSQVRVMLGHPVAIQGLYNIIKARKRVSSKNKHSTVVNCVISTLGASILLYFGIVVEDLDLESIVNTRKRITKKAQHKTPRPMLIKPFNQKLPEAGKELPRSLLLKENKSSVPLKRNRLENIRSSLADFTKPYSRHHQPEDLSSKPLRRYEMSHKSLLSDDVLVAVDEILGLVRVGRQSNSAVVVPGSF